MNQSLQTTVFLRGVSKEVAEVDTTKDILSKGVICKGYASQVVFHKDVIANQFCESALLLESWERKR